MRARISREQHGNDCHTFRQQHVCHVNNCKALLTLIPGKQFSPACRYYPPDGEGWKSDPVYVANQPSHHWREELIRVDHNLTENQRIAVHYIYDTGIPFNQGPLWSSTTTLRQHQHQFKGPTTSFVARLPPISAPRFSTNSASYTDDHIFFSVGNNATCTGALTLLLSLPRLARKILLFCLAIPLLPIASINPTPHRFMVGRLQRGYGYFPWKNATPLTPIGYRHKIIGTHTLFFGAYFAAAQKNSQRLSTSKGQLSYAFNSTFPANPFADLCWQHRRIRPERQPTLFPTTLQNPRAFLPG